MKVLVTIDKNKRFGKKNTPKREILEDFIRHFRGSTVPILLVRLLCCFTDGRLSAKTIRLWIKDHLGILLENIQIREEHKESMKLEIDVEDLDYSDIERVLDQMLREKESNDPEKLEIKMIRLALPIINSAIDKETKDLLIMNLVNGLSDLLCKIVNGEAAKSGIDIKMKDIKLMN